MAKVIETYRNKTLKSYGVNEDYNYIGFGLNIVEVQKCVEHFAFTFENTPKKNVPYSSFFLYCIIPTFRNVDVVNEIPDLFYGKLSLHHLENRFDNNKVNFGNFLFDKLGLKTKGKRFRNVSVPVDIKNSKNFEPQTAIDLPMNLNLLDGDGNFFYNLTIDWKSKCAFITIPKKNSNLFTDIYFPNSTSKPVEKVVLPVCANIIDTKQIVGFDKSGEPYIETCESGMLQLVFNFMPPLNGNDNQTSLRVFNRFDKELQKILSTDVVWEDRERMLIPKPNEDTIELLIEYLENFWENQTLVANKSILNKSKSPKDTSVIRLILNLIKAFLR